MIARILVVSLLLSGCRTTQDDVGTLCVGTDAVQGVPSELDVGLQASLSLNYGCDSRRHDYACDVELDGDVLRFTSDFRATTRFTLTCDSMIRTMRAECDVPPLEPGRYTVEYAGQAVDIEVPGTLDDPCITPPP